MAGVSRAPKKKSARTTKKPAAPGKKGAGIEKTLLRANALLRKEFEKARAKIKKLRGAGNETFDELWEEVNRVLSHEPPLYVGGGYKSLEAFVAKELPGESARSVKRNVLVARSFSPDDETRHGINFLEEVALYAKDLAGAKSIPAAIDLDRLMVAVRIKGGDTRRKKARDATIDEVRKARRALVGRAEPKRPASAAEAALRRALSKSPALRGIGLRATRTEASFGGVPLDALVAFGKAVAAVQISNPRDKRVEV